ncbi:MAG: HEPN domain-containing protein [Methanobrevibacter sp.]|jgi:uncharacterized protein (UPF0332 family)|nr:HEPN domain-containing protein [Candidatus Methanovirga basalitermitum]
MVSEEKLFFNSALEVAQLNIDNGYYASVNRSYYGVFYAAKASLSKRY